MTSVLADFNPTLDLKLERDVDVPVELVWKAWTTPEHLRHWFIPKPWSLASVEMDLRRGGAFNLVMRSPEGQEFPNFGCYLDIVPNQRLIFTDTMLAGFRPAAKPFFTAALLLAPTATGTRYTALAIHGEEAARKRHEEMGFTTGWGTVLDQLVAFIKQQG
jgi:uncharacterized protein YndB with AHSA1/START domain